MHESYINNGLYAWSMKIKVQKTAKIECCQYFRDLLNFINHVFRGLLWGARSPCSPVVRTLPSLLVHPCSRFSFHLVWTTATPWLHETLHPCPTSDSKTLQFLSSDSLISPTSFSPKFPLMAAHGCSYLIHNRAGCSLQGCEEICNSLEVQATGQPQMVVRSLYFPTNDCWSSLIGLDPPQWRNDLPTPIKLEVTFYLL